MRSIFLFPIITMLAVSCYGDTSIIDPSGNEDFLTIQDAVYASDINLVAHWKLDGEAIDSSGNGFDGTVYGNPNWVAEGMDGVSILLDGLGDYVEVSGYTGISGGGSRTCSAWIKTTAAEPGLIISWGYSAAGQKWMFRVESDGSLGVGVWDGYIKTTNQFVNDGNWHHVAAVLADDGSPDVTEIQLYIDGVQEMSPYISNSRAIATADSQNVVIGARLDAEGISYTGHFEGSIDDVRIYDAALNAEEIVEIMGPVPDVWVDDDYTPEGSNDGHTWGYDAFDTIQAGIDSARYGATVHVAAGTYAENITLKNGVALIGAGTDTIIQGNSTNMYMLNRDSSYTVTSFDCDSGTLLQGFMVTNGYSQDVGGINNNYYGGMYNYYSNPTVTNCTFSDYAAPYGGGMYNYYSNPTVTNCTFSDNTASYGGGMYNTFSSPTVSHCTFSNNMALYGGGMCNREGGLIVVTYCTFDGNQAHSAGGGVFNDAGDLTVSNCKFVDNVAEDSFPSFPNSDPEPTIGKGGALYFYSGGSCEMVNCTLTDNRAYEAGGGLYLSNYGQATLTNCILWGNSATLSGSENEIENNNDERSTSSPYLPVISYCDIAGCGGSGIEWNPLMGIDGGGNIDADPLFEGANGAVRLDGLDDYVEIPGYTGISGGGSRTCSAWIKTATTQPGQIVSWGSSAAGEKWMFRIESDGSLGVGVWEGYIKTTTQFVNDGNWHHVAAVLADDGSPDVSEIQLYIDGVLETSPFINNSQSIATTDDQNVVIGALLDADGVNYASYFHDQIGDVRIYSRALSPFEIQQLMNDDLPTTDLEAYWKLDGNADDASGNDRHGVLYGGPVWTTERSVEGALQLDGMNDHVNIPGYTGISGGGSRTCSAWIKTTAAEPGLIISWGYSAAGQKWMFRVESDGSLGVGVWDGYIKTTNQFVNDGNWHHVAAVLADDGSPDVSEIQLYIDGVLEMSPYINNSRAIATTDSQNVVIGALLDADGVNYASHFQGSIDDVLIYSRALSPSEIQQVMNDDLPTTDLQAHWKLDGNADDASGNDRHGILYGGAVWTTEDPIDVLNLDGLDDYVEVSDYTGISGGGSRTCSAWIRTAASELGLIVSWGSPADGQKWMFRMESDGSLGVGVWGGYIKTTTQFVNDGNWHHVAAVLADDGSPDVSEIQLYIDGVLETNPFISNSQAIATTDSEDVVLGARLDTDGVNYASHFEGRLRDIRIYSRALNPSEIQQVMDDENAPTTDLEGHWQLDGNADDVSGNDRHGILYGGPIWTGGRFVGDPVDVLCLDGLDDYVDIPGYTGISGGGSRTCSAWIKPIATQPGQILSWGSSAAGQKWMFRTESDGSLGVGVWGGYIKTTNYGDNWQFVNDGNWHHVAAVLADDGSPDVSEIQLYIDGVLETNPFISNSQAIATTDSEDVVIGARLDTDGVNYASHFEGRLRDIRIYSRALNPSEIQQMMNDEGAPTTDLEGHWQLDDNTDDVSGNDRHGILYGEPVWATDFFVDGGYNLRLKQCSPCINAGNKDALPGDILTDLDGKPRVIDGQVDMGAYEFKNTPPVADAGEDKIVYAWVDGWEEVQLDGTGSTDEDGDVLEYYWYNDANELIATGAESNVVLGVGEHLITLIVNDEIEDSAPDVCVVRVVEALETEARVLPRTLNIKRHRQHVIGYLKFDGRRRPELASDQPMLLLAGDANIEAMYQRLMYSRRERSWYLVGIFDSDAVIDSLPSGDEVTVTLICRFDWGQWVYGTDMVKVKAKKTK